MGKLILAVKAQNVGDVKKLLRSESIVNERDNYNQTSLHLASGLSANIEIVKLLLKKKADVNAQERDGWTPLHCGASEGRYDICALLLATDNIDVGTINKDGTSALHYLVRGTPDSTPAGRALFQEVLRLYIDKGGEINIQSKHGESALHQSCLRGNVIAVEFLLENKAEIDCVNKFVPPVAPFVSSNVGPSFAGWEKHLFIMLHELARKRSSRCFSSMEPTQWSSRVMEHLWTSPRPWRSQI
jgi:ankyrin repeat protein